MAARNINQIQELVAYIIRKARGAFQTFDEVDNMLHMGQIDLYEDYYADYLRDGILPTALEPFKSRFSFSYATTTGGLLAKPSDYGHYLNGYGVTWNNSLGKSIRQPFVPLNETEIDDALKSQLRPISITNPAIVMGGTNFVLYPQEPQAGYLNYLITPVAPVFAYTEVGRVITYDAPNSVQLAWTDVYINKVILKALSYIGINLSEPQVTAYAEGKSQITTV